MKRVLIYYHPNKKSISLESQIHLLRANGFEVFVLTISSKGVLHQDLDKINVPNFSYPLEFKNSLFHYFFLTIYLIYFSYRYKVNYIFAHLQIPCLIAGFSQFLIRSKCIFFRHNSSIWNDQDIYKDDININERRIDFLINKLAKKIVVPSKGVKDYMIKNENVKEDKIQILHYLYDFRLYPKPNIEIVNRLRLKYKTPLLLIMVSRMVRHKRHLIVFEALEELIKKGCNIKLLVLDSGPEQSKLENYVVTNTLQNNIFFIGYVENPIDYMKAADVLVQPSMTDASNSVAKEMGILSKLVMVTDGVGDYSEYIKHGKNGILLPTNDTKDFLINEIEKVYNNNYDNNKLGASLKKTILETYSKEVLEKEYSDFLRKNLL
jgi:glycosyltransferase involved in cell wall biosynthesis